MNFKRSSAAAASIILSVMLIGLSASTDELGNCSDSIRRCHNACIWAVETSGSSIKSEDCQAACGNQFTQNSTPAVCSGKVVPNRIEGDCSDSIGRCYNSCVWAVETGGGNLPAEECMAACKNQFTDNSNPALCAVN